MAGKIQIPVNLEDQAVLKRFLTNLVLNFNTNPLITGAAKEVNAALAQAFGAGDSSFLDTLADIADVQTKIKTYVEQNVETIIKQNAKDIALIAEQFGTFYDEALAASWYGLSVKAGGTVAGLEIGSLDPNTTTPGDESSYFRISADSFLVGKAYEDLTQAEKDYLAANNLPNFGTAYDGNGDAIPAFLVNWNTNTSQYDIFFNGRVSFNNVDTGLTDGSGNTVIDGAFIKTGSITTDQLEMNTGWAGVIYNQGGSAASYTMKIDFTNGEIHIK